MQMMSLLCVCDASSWKKFALAGLLPPSHFSSQSRPSTSQRRHRSPRAQPAPQMDKMHSRVEKALLRISDNDQSYSDTCVLPLQRPCPLRWHDGRSIVSSFICLCLCPFLLYSHILSLLHALSLARALSLSPLPPSPKSSLVLIALDCYSAPAPSHAILPPPLPPSLLIVLIVRMVSRVPT